MGNQRGQLHLPLGPVARDFRADRVPRMAIELGGTRREPVEDGDQALTGD